MHAQYIQLFFGYSIHVFVDMISLGRLYTLNKFLVFRLVSLNQDYFTSILVFFFRNGHILADNEHYKQGRQWHLSAEGSLNFKSHVTSHDLIYRFHLQMGVE